MKATLINIIIFIYAKIAQRWNRGKLEGGAHAKE